MVQSVLGMIMDAITIGIVFARISHPKQRGRTIAISDSAVISRRDGILKFMFRIADIRRTQVWHLAFKVLAFSAAVDSLLLFQVKLLHFAAPLFVSS